MTENRLEKLPPHNSEAEESVLGAMLIDPGAVLRVSPILDAAAGTENLPRSCPVAGSNIQSVGPSAKTNSLSVASLEIL